MAREIKLQKWVARLTHAERVSFAGKLREMIYAAKNRPCTDCRNFYVQSSGVRMTFDHLDASKKLFDIGSVGVNEHGELGHRLVHMKTLKEEIAKCEVVCLRCHKKREERRRLARIERGEWVIVFARLGLVMGRCWAVARERAFQEQRLRNRVAGSSFTQSWRYGVTRQAQLFARAFNPWWGLFKRPSRPRPPQAPAELPIDRSSDAFYVGRVFRLITQE